MFTNLRRCLPFTGIFATIICANPALSQVCIDTDGDGWGWDGSASCVVETTATSETCIDSDGDGYGWDGSATCIVSPVLQPQSVATPAVDSSSSGECIDSDGDGWGWDGTASCVVVPVATDNTAEITTPPQSTSPAVSQSSSGFNSQRDLVALHFDHAPDPDDGHAAVAGLMVTDRLGLSVQVVGGTYGEYSRDRYLPESEGLMNAVWGSQWLNAHTNRAAAVNAAADRWSSVLAAGGNVWVAEGGPSDFTAAVVQRLNQLYSEFNTSNRINVIQHSVWNEDHALAVSLNYVRANTNYVRIDDGNDPNSTADLRFESHNNGSFVSRARSSSYSNEWAVAFNYLPPGNKLDFSDTVELLHIVGLGISVIKDVNEFGDYFF